MSTSSPRRDWHRSRTGPRYSLGVMIVASTIGSSTRSYVPGCGISVGLCTTIVSSPRITWNSTFGAVAISSRPNSRSRRSFTMSMWSRPRNPHRNPNPSACEVSGSKHERRVVQLQLVERLAQLRVVAALGREQPAPHHRPRLPIAGQRLAGAALPRERHRVADLDLVDVLQAGDEVPDLAGLRLGTGVASGAKTPHSSASESRPVGHEAHLRARAQHAVLHPHVRHDAAVRVERRVEDQGAQRVVRGPVGRRDAPDDLVEQLRHALPGLGRDARISSGSHPTTSASSRAVPAGSACGRSILFRTGTIVRPASRARWKFASVCASIPCAASTSSTAPSHAASDRETSYVKSTWPGRVDQVELVLVAGSAVGQPDGLRLDRDAPLALEVHLVQVLLAHVPVGDGVRELEQPVGQRRLPVVDVGDDAEVPDPGWLGHGALSYGPGRGTPAGTLARSWPTSSRRSSGTVRTRSATPGTRPFAPR